MIRAGEPGDRTAILTVYRAAKEYMARSGNPNQWVGNYPEMFLEEDLAAGRLYVICGPDGAVHGSFVLTLEEEPSYRVIDGAWHSDRPYGTIHRLAGDGTMGGLFRQCLDFCAGRSPYLRADTHRTNHTMRHLLEGAGFRYCGIINLDRQEGDTLRVAYDYFA